VSECAIVIRPYEARDQAAVRALFIAVNRGLAPPDLRDAFEAYITRSLAEEIDRVPDYYASRHGSFWVATDGGEIAGMFGIERVDETSAELRRMYVASHARRRGIARQMLARAEAICCQSGYSTLTLSTSQLQQAALAFYRGAGYRLLREEVAAAQTNKTVGGDIRRYYFDKAL
jgi:ribosomal protein S18 acetylase RimI-like enzyme